MKYNMGGFDNLLNLFVFSFFSIYKCLTLAFHWALFLFCLVHKYVKRLFSLFLFAVTHFVFFFSFWFCICSICIHFVSHNQLLYSVWNISICSHNSKTVEFDFRQHTIEHIIVPVLLFGIPVVVCFIVFILFFFIFSSFYPDFSGMSLHWFTLQSTPTLVILIDG